MDTVVIEDYLVTSLNAPGTPEVYPKHSIMHIKISYLPRATLQHWLTRSLPSYLSSIFLCLHRDEIYCQICKQLVNNRDRNSRTQGWILLSICLGIFPPTDFFMKVSLQLVQNVHESLVLLLDIIVKGWQTLVFYRWFSRLVHWYDQSSKIIRSVDKIKTSGVMLSNVAQHQIRLWLKRNVPWQK